MSKGSESLDIPRIGRLITIWDEVLLKPKVSFYGPVIRKKVFSESSHRIETHLDVVVEVLEAQSSVSFEFCIDEYLIELWLADLMFESPHAINFGIISTVQWWSSPVSQDHSGRFWRIQCILLDWWGFRVVSMIYHLCDGWCDHCEIICELY